MSTSTQPSGHIDNRAPPGCARQRRCFHAPRHADPEPAQVQNPRRKVWRVPVQIFLMEARLMSDVAFKADSAEVERKLAPPAIGELQAEPQAGQTAPSAPCKHNERPAGPFWCADVGYATVAVKRCRADAEGWKDCLVQNQRPELTVPGDMLWQRPAGPQRDDFFLWPVRTGGLASQ